MTLASLLGRGNLPDMPEAQRICSRLIIATREADVLHFRASPRFQAVEDLLAVKFLFFEPSRAQDSKMASMSLGHRRLLSDILPRRSVVLFLTADMIFAERSLHRCGQWLDRGIELVLIPALRFNEAKVLAGIRRDGIAISVGQRALARLAIHGPHSETLTYDWRSAAFAHNPTALVARSADRGLMVMHSLSWAPILMDYAAIRRHDGRTLKHWTMDGDYVSRNFGGVSEAARVVVDDSDTFLMVSLTSEEELSLPQGRQSVFRLFPRLASAIRRRRVRRFVASPAIDALKRALFARGVVLRARPPAREDETLIAALADEARLCLRPSAGVGARVSDALLGTLELGCNGAFWIYWAYRVWGVVWRAPAARISWCWRNRGLVRRRLRERLLESAGTRR
jgi:hypothetical protein